MQDTKVKLEAAVAELDQHSEPLGDEVYKEMKVQSIAYTAALTDLLGGNLALSTTDEESLISCIDQFCTIAGLMISNFQPIDGAEA